MFPQRGEKSCSVKIGQGMSGQSTPRKGTKAALYQLSVGRLIIAWHEKYISYVIY